MISVSSGSGAWRCSLKRLDAVDSPLEHLLERIVGFDLGQGELAGEHLIEDAAEEEDIGPFVPLGTAAGPLQRRVVDGPLAVGGGHLPLVVDRGESEVDELGLCRWRR